MNTLYPWQLDLWQHLQALRQRLPHAILLHGRRGIGKKNFAQVLAAALICESTNEQGFACGHCSACSWLEQGNHPDFRLLEPEQHAANTEDHLDASSQENKKKSRQILIDQVRGLSELVNLTTHRHGLRIIILQPAETLNLNAASALLKILEEPPASTLFILITHQLPRLLPTIRSRCHQIAMPIPARDVAASWLAEQGISDPVFFLAQAGGAPLSALEADHDELRSNIDAFTNQLIRCEQIDPAASASNWHRDDYALALSTLQKWSYDITACRLGNRVRYYPAQTSSLQSLAKSVNLLPLLDFQRKLVKAQAWVNHQLNNELQLEALLIQYSRLFIGNTDHG